MSAILLAVAVAAGLGTSLARAQERSAAPAIELKAEDKLSQERLIALIAKMDSKYRVSPVKNAKGEETGTQYLMKIEHKNVTYDITVSWMRGYIWLQTNVARVNLQNLSADQLRSLLAVQFPVGPSYFAFHEQNQMLALSHRVDREIGRAHV